ncbi:MAG: thiosulfohydrolase SoxB [Rhodomicrobium sp.]|nr:thiosulfohydrolase SoxB [Rhodomicrobium sp.]
MLSRREFLAAMAAASASVAGASGLPLGRALAQQKLTQDMLLQSEPLGRLTLLHITDIHAQLKPVYFREPSINIGVGEAKGKPPHQTGADFLKTYGIDAGSADAYALTFEDFALLAKSYGRMGGLDRIATIVKAIRGERGEDNVLLLDGGDTWQGSWTSLRTKAQDMIDLMSLLRPDAMVGHWEFTFGAERVEEAVKALPFAFLAQNIRDAEWQEPVFEASKIFERGGAKIAVIGQAFPYTPIANPRWMMPKWEFGIREEDLTKQVEEARAAGADLVVLLSHNGFDVDRKLASRVEGIDVILTGHTHDALPAAVKEGRTLLLASGSHGKFVSRLDLDIKDKAIADFRFKLIPVFSDVIAADAEMAAAIAKARAPFEAELSRVVGHTDSLLYRRGNFNGTFDDLICEAMLAERDAEIALSPGVRWGASLLPGDPITFEAIANATAITYPNCYRTEMTGAFLKEIFEDIADNIFNPDPYYQQGGDMVRAGGLGYRIDVNAPIGSRISDMTLLKTGQPLDAAKSYAVTGWASINEGTEGPPIWEVVERHVAAAKTIRVKENASVKIVGA